MNTNIVKIDFYCLIPCFFLVLAMTNFWRGQAKTFFWQGAIGAALLGIPTLIGGNIVTGAILTAMASICTIMAIIFKKDDPKF